MNYQDGENKMISLLENNSADDTKNPRLKKYVLKHKDIPLITFTYHKEVMSAIVNAENKKYLPLPLKRIIHSKQEFVARGNDEFLIVNAEGCWLVEAWLGDREVPVNRVQFKRYVKKGTSATQWMLENHGCSFTDCYWIMQTNEAITWDEVKYYNYQAIDTLQVILNNNQRMYKGINSTLGGELEKFWYLSQDNHSKTLKMCKKTDKLSDILSARECIASLIYKKQGYELFTDYQFVYDTKKEVIGCKCDAFTSEQVELVTAYDLLEEINETQVAAVYERIIDQAEVYGGNRQEISDYMDLQTIVDYLILNRDRHQNNIGFLRNSDTLEIISPAPIYDSGSSKYMEQTEPEKVIGTTVNGLYDTDEECLDHVKNWNVLDISKLPSKNDLRAIYDQCANITQKRKDELLALYEGKIAYLLERTKNIETPNEIDLEEPV